MTTATTPLEAWVTDELSDRARRRWYGLINYEDNQNGGMIPGMYVVYAWSGPSLTEMRLGGGQALFDNLSDADNYCSELDYTEVTENMTADDKHNNLRWTISYIPFV
jgi:hypothetical protein